MRNLIDRIVSENLPAELEEDEEGCPKLVPKPVEIIVDGISFFLQANGIYVSSDGEVYNSPLQTLIDAHNRRVPSLH